MTSNDINSEGRRWKADGSYALTFKKREIGCIQFKAIEVIVYNKYTQSIKRTKVAHSLGLYLLVGFIVLEKVRKRD